MPHGARVIIKDDRDSSVGRGAVLYAGHFRPEMACVLYQVARTAPEALTEVVISEGWRNVRERRDLHEELRAFDVSLNGIHGGEALRREMGEEWADRLSQALGPDYHIVVHGSGTNLHIHIELDP